MSFLSASLPRPPPALFFSVRLGDRPAASRYNVKPPTVMSDLSFVARKPLVTMSCARRLQFGGRHRQLEFFLRRH